MPGIPPGKCSVGSDTEEDGGFNSSRAHRTPFEQGFCRPTRLLMDVIGGLAGSTAWERWTHDYSTEVFLGGDPDLSVATPLPNAGD
jgi:hypothetical protein